MHFFIFLFQPRKLHLKVRKSKMTVDVKGDLLLTFLKKTLKHLSTFVLLSFSLLAAKKLLPRKYSTFVKVTFLFAWVESKSVIMHLRICEIRTPP